MFGTPVLWLTLRFVITGGFRSSLIARPLFVVLREMSALAVSEMFYQKKTCSIFYTENQAFPVLTRTFDRNKAAKP